MDVWYSTTDRSPRAIEEDLPPIEEYLQTTRRIIDNNKLSPRVTRILRETMSRFEQCQEHASTTCDLPACRLSRSPVHPQSYRVEKVVEKNRGSRRHSPIDAIDREAAPITSEDALKSADDGSAFDGSENVNSLAASRLVESKSEDRNSTASDSSLAEALASRTAKTSRDAERENDLPRSACDMELLAIDSPFSNFSLRNMKPDRALQRRIDVRKILEQSEPTTSESEPSTSSNIVRDPREKYEKSGANFDTDNDIKSATNAPLLKKEMEVIEEVTTDNQETCQCQ